MLSTFRSYAVPCKTENLWTKKKKKKIQTKIIPFTNITVLLVFKRIQNSDFAGLVNAKCGNL